MPCFGIKKNGDNYFRVDLDLEASRSGVLKFIDGTDELSSLERKFGDV